MAKTLVNKKGVTLMIVLLVPLFLGILSIDSFSLASDTEASESSTAQTYYDYLIDYQQKDVDKLIKFKEGVGRNISGLKENINRLNSEVKSGQHKYTYSKESTVLGSLYGSKGKLKLDKSRYSRYPDMLSSVTAVTDTETLDLVQRSATSTAPTPPPPPPSIVCSQICSPECHTECQQVGYGQRCNQVCKQVCKQVCN